MKNNAVEKLSKKSNGFYLLVFFIVFIGALLISLILKSIQLYNQAHFTSKSIMVLIVTPEDSHIMRIDTESKKISQLKITDVQINAKNLKNASINTGVPLHASLTVDKSIENIQDVFTVGNMIKLLASNKITFNQLNEWDGIKIALESQKVSPEDHTVREIKNYIHDRSIISQIDKELYELFRDPEVINEQISIEVVNATSVTGLASSVAKMLENGGYSVVSIRSSDTASSSIQTNENASITAGHIQKIFSFPVSNRGKNAVADIRIVIGEDAIQ
jgi:hypothetical protein